jgi:hypothetical protein
MMNERGVGQSGGGSRPLCGGVVVACMAIAGLVVGCSSGSTVDVAKVSGTVTLDGQPLGDADVRFQPAGGRPSWGRTKADGSYQLLYTVNRAGAMVGPCSVTISTAIEDDEGRFAPERVPKRYFEPGALSAEVKPRGNVHNFDLTTSGGG